MRWPGLGRFALQRAGGGEIRTGPETDPLEALGRIEPSRAAEWLEAILDYLGELLLVRRAVRLDGIGTLHVVLRPPELESTRRGHRLIRPVATVVELRVDGPVLRPEGPCLFAFAADERLERWLARLKPTAILLVVPERDAFVDVLVMRLRAAGWEVEVHTDVEQALAAVHSGGAYLVLLDAALERAQEFAAGLKLNRETSMTPLVVTYPDLTMFLRPSGLMVVGDENIAEPYEFQALLDVVESEVARAAEERLIFLQQVGIHIPTDEGAIARLHEVFAGLLRSSGLKEEGQMAMATAFQEAVRNAADHGNRNRRECKIEVTYLLTSETLTVTVRDAGEGFDHRLYVQRGERGAVFLARRRAAQGRVGGLGILMMLKCTHHLEYNEAGNQVTLVRRL